MNNDQFHRPLYRRATIGSNRRRRHNHKPGWIALGVILTLATITALSA